MTIALRLGTLGGGTVAIRRSGVNWLCEDGHLCRPREVIGFCNLAIQGGARERLFADESVVQVAFASPFGGRLRQRQGLSGGGFLDVIGAADWRPDEVIGEIETEAVHGDDACDALLLILAGQRMSWAVDVDTGLLPGWNLSARAWWASGTGSPRSLLSLGVCDATGPVRGDRSGFTELFEGAQFPAHVGYVTDHPLAPCAPVLVDGFSRTRAEFEALAADLQRGLAESSEPPTPADWFFAGALLAQLGASPMSQDFPMLTRDGVTRSGPPRAILLSSCAETRSILRHKKLGYRLHIMAHDRRAAGRAVAAWLGSAFETVSRSLDDVAADYRQLAKSVDAETGARLLILNRMSTSGREDIANYTAFDAPLGATLANIAAKEVNLMLHDLGREAKVSIVDVDAMAADIGGAAHLPDGVHQSGELQALVRGEILDVLASALEPNV
ncbi:MAG TPA: hypothetical protein VIJ59_01955 [Caulobacteraceae bacterium]